MIKLKDIMESFPATIEYRMRKFKSKLSPGKIILKSWGNTSHTDELHMYLDDKLENNTKDYSNVGDSHITIRTMKIGEVAHDQHLGMVIDFALDKVTLFPSIVTLDSQWRFLKSDEIRILKKFLQKKISDPNQENNTNEKDMNQTCQQVIEKYSKLRIRL